MHILYYITGHGYGHGVRSCAIINALPPDIRVTIRTSLPETFFAEELHHAYRYYPAVFDCGCVQIDGVLVDIPATLRTYADIALRNEHLLEADADWCRAEGVSLIVTDMAPFPCAVAVRAGIPSIAVGNFSWCDIYEPYLAEVPSFAPVLAGMRAQYASANLLLALDPPNAMSDFPVRIPIPAIGRNGRNRSRELREAYRIPPADRICLIYTGNYGMDSVLWKRLESFTGWTFVGVYPLPGDPANFRCISKSDFSFPDISASADLVLSKLGYGIITECFAEGIPLIYLPRVDFAEYPVLARAVTEWGHGIEVSEEAYYSLDIAAELALVIARPRPVPQSCRGAEIAAGEIADRAALCP